MPVNHILIVTIAVTSMVLVFAFALLNSKHASSYALDDEGFSNDCVDAKVYQESMNVWNQSLKVDSDNPDVLTNIDIAFLKQCNYEEAIQYFDQALASDPNHVTAMHCKGNALAELGNTTTANEYYNRSLGLDPGCKNLHNSKSGITEPEIMEPIF